MSTIKRIVRLPGVIAMVALSRSTVLNKVAAGEFPAPIHLGARARGWIEAEVLAWIEARISSTRGEQQ
jgi:prophage regulatory protein